MDPGYRTPIIELFRSGAPSRDARLLAARGAMPAATHEQLALLVLLSDDADAEIAAAARATLSALPEPALRSFLSGPDVPDEMRRFFTARIADAGTVAAAGAPLPPEKGEENADSASAADEPGADGADDDEDDDDDAEETSAEPKLLAGLPIKKKIKLASKGTREQRAQLIRDPNKLVASAVLSSPKLTESEVEAFAKMANVSDEVLRVIGTNRTWLKNYGVVLGLVRNPKTPIGISMQLLQRISERDMKMLAVDRNVPESLRLTARKFIVKSLK